MDVVLRSSMGSSSLTQNDSVLTVIQLMNSTPICTPDAVSTGFDGRENARLFRTADFEFPTAFLVGKHHWGCCRPCDTAFASLFPPHLPVLAAWQKVKNGAT